MQSASVVLSVTVIQMWLIAPGPDISASVAVSPAFSVKQGLPLRDGPRWLAAMPPLPGSPVGFSQLMVRERAF